MKRNTGLDILRGVAVILVLFRHYEILKYMTFIGWIGVDLFFVLSGFLVSGLLFKEYKRVGKINFKQFFIRRGFKIYPSFYFFLFLATPLTLLLGKNIPISTDRVISELFFLQSYMNRIWNHTWSLAVEEHFYIFIIILFWILKHDETKNFTKRIFISCVIILVIVLIGRMTNCFIHRNDGVNLTSFNMFTHFRIDSLTFGIILSLMYHFHFEKFVAFFKEKSLFLSGIAILLIIPPFYFPFNSVYIAGPGLSMLYAGLGIIVVKFMLFDFTSIKNKIVNRLLKGLSFVGVYSYTIYLWHLPIQLVLIDYSESKNLFVQFIIFGVYIIASISIGYITSITIEKLGLKYREKHYPS